MPNRKREFFQTRIQCSYQRLEPKRLLAITTGASDFAPSFVLDSSKPQFTEESEIRVTSALDSGPGTLRNAIQFANAAPTLQIIVFDLPAGSKISLDSSLPPITEDLIIDATTHPDYAGVPVIEVSGRDSGRHTYGFQINANYTTIKGLSITNFASHGIEVVNGHHADILQNYIGVNLANQEAGNRGRGIHVSGSNHTEIVDNLISANHRDGVFLDINSSETNVRRNSIGVSPDELASMGNGAAGIQVRSPDNTIEDNLISGNDWAGVAINDYNASHNALIANRIGLDVSANPLPNKSYGIFTTSSNNTILDNVVGGNRHQGLFLRRADHSVVERNRIGINERNEAVPNAWGGVRIVATVDLEFANNIVSGNSGIGVFLGGNRTQGVMIRDNLIGTDETGRIPVGNSSFGIHVHSAIESQVFRNTISANGVGGVFTVGTENLANEYFANWIGVASDGVTRLNNQHFGMWVASDGNLIGRTGSPNVISDHLRPIAVSNSSNNEVVGNYIGTDLGERKDLGGIHGVLLVANASDNRIQKNIFDHVDTAIRNPNGGTGNYFFDNRMRWQVGMGIDNGLAGFNHNDSNDADEGPNRLLNSPERLRIVSGGVDGKIEFELGTTPGNANYPITIFAYRTSADRVGLELIGSQIIFHGPEKQLINLEIENGDRISLLAVDADLNTSEFSPTVVFEGN